MATVRQDTLYVRTYAADKNLGDRVVIDFERDPEVTRFIMLDHEGATICLGFERQLLTWSALRQIADAINIGFTTLKPPNVL